MMVWGTAFLCAALAFWQIAFETGRIANGFETWRPILYAYVLWAIALCAAQVIVNGDKGQRTLFVLPAALFVISLVVFPLLFALYISFTDWNLASPSGPQPNGWSNLIEMWNDGFSRLNPRNREATWARMGVHQDRGGDTVTNRN